MLCWYNELASLQIDYLILQIAQNSTDELPSSMLLRKFLPHSCNIECHHQGIFLVLVIQLPAHCASC